MSTWSFIYCTGILASLAYGTYIFAENKRINPLDFLFVTIFSLLSWIMVLGFWIGQNIKYGQKDNLK
jgi:hypothetical protein